MRDERKMIIKKPEYIIVKDSKHFTWDVMNNCVTVHVNARTNIVIRNGHTVRFRYMSTTMQVFHNGCFVDVNNTISRKLSQFKVYDSQSLDYDYYKIQFPAMGR